MSQREQWATRIGLVLAMAGNAIGLGNFLRFPRQAALNGGGAFMIPYFVALILLGLPLIWVEWSMGRYGGQFGASTTVGAFDHLSKNRTAKYLGSIGFSLPLLMVLFYAYIESWTLAYAFFSLTKWYFGITDMSHMNTFLRGFQGLVSSEYFTGVTVSMMFWIITIALNVIVLAGGVAGGIEKLAKIAMPLLFAFAIILVVRVLTLGTPDPSVPENSVSAGLAYIWNPDFSMLGNAGVWLAAAGQIFFTLSIGMGTIACYASYVKKDDDVALTGLSTASANEFAEVILGGTIAIPIAVAFLGLAATKQIAAQGSFDLGFVAMPMIFQKLPMGFIFATMWFLLLFFAGITSSVALSQPFMGFMQDDLGVKRKVSAIIIGVIMFVFGLPNILFLKQGYLDQCDFWIGTFGFVVFGLIEVIIFAWAFGGKNMWEELTRGSEIKIPRIFYYIIRYVAPVYLIILLVSWVWQDLTSGKSIIMLSCAGAECKFYLWLSRAVIIGFLVAGAVLVRIAYKRKSAGEVTI